MILIQEFVGLHFEKCIVSGLSSLAFFSVYNMVVFLHIEETLLYNDGSALKCNDLKLSEGKACKS